MLALNVSFVNNYLKENVILLKSSSMTHRGCSTNKSTGFTIFQRSIFFDINVERGETFR